MPNCFNNPESTKSFIKISKQLDWINQEILAYSKAKLLKIKERTQNIASYFKSIREWLKNNYLETNADIEFLEKNWPNLKEISEIDKEVLKKFLFYNELDDFLLFNDKKKRWKKVNKKVDDEDGIIIVEAKGIFKYKNGETFIGEYKNNKKEGKGRLIWDKNVYYGEFKNDLYEGNGIVKFNNGDKFEGVFNKNKEEGKVFELFK